MEQVEHERKNHHFHDPEHGKLGEFRQRTEHRLLRFAHAFFVFGGAWFDEPEDEKSGNSEVGCRLTKSIE